MLTDLAATEKDVKSIYKVGLNTTRFLLASGDVVIGYLLLRGAAVAAEKLPAAACPRRTPPSTRARSPPRSSSRPSVLPRLAVQRALAESIDQSVMELDEAAF